MAIEGEWYVERDGKKFGPLTSQQLKALAGNGKLKPDDIVLHNGKRARAKDVKGLFPKPSTELITRPAAIVQKERPMPPVVATVVDAVPSNPTQDCPFCGESILAVAKKCKHCGEILDVALRAAMTPQVQAAPVAPAQQTTVHIVNNVQGNPSPRWSRGTAIILSFLIPGLGQMYKGQIINGVAWFLFVLVGYAAFIVPGLVLHLLCIAGAGMGDPYR